MKKILLLTLTSILLLSCAQIKKNDMQKDAREYVEIVVKALSLDDEEVTVLAALITLKFDANVSLKKQSIIQKYQGDELVEFSKILQTEWKEKRGQDIPDMILMALLQEKKQ